MSAPMGMRVGFATEAGSVRDRNEDACCARSGLLAVADGMGGHRAGEVAAALALACVEEGFAGGEPGGKAVRHLFERAHRLIQQEGARRPDWQGMGTTLTAAWVVGSTLLIGHVGDSRAYLVREGRARQLTEDHSVAGELVKNGALSPQEARRHPHRHVLTRSLGGPGPLQADVVEVALRPGDRVVLCTDGVSDAVPDPDLAGVVSRASDPREAAQALVRLAAVRGASDNMTAVVGFVEGFEAGGASPWEGPRR